MPIDKIIPRFLVSDEDERLLKEGAMTDALNVTISEDGDGTEGVVKNVKGTNHVNAFSADHQIANDDEITVIGQVSDSQRGFIYYFVSDNDAHDNDAIYQHDTSANTYKEVFKNSFLNFDSDYFVKADVLNGAFQQDGVIQTILYFTDNNNAPRKINVDRALLGDYDNLSSSRLDYALSAMRAAPTTPPSAKFSTDTNFNINNFRDSALQFALQYIYVDGEESAISPYSKLVFNDLIATEGVEDFSLVTGKKYFQDNVCEISLAWSSDTSNELNIPDVEKIRILVRNGNDGAFFSVDEINPNQDLSSTVMGVTTQIYDKDTCVYKFFNDRITSPVDTTLVNKLYDNVPLFAASQSLASNRLFYSDYKEGRANHTPSAIVEAVYEPERSGSLDFTDTSDVTHYFVADSTTYPRNGFIGFDYDGVFNSQDIPSNSTVTLSFDFNPSGSFSRVSPTANEEYAITAFSTSSDGTASIGFGKMGANTLNPTFNSNSGGVMIKKDANDFRFSVTVDTSSALSPQGFAEALKLELEDNPIYWTQSYTLTSAEMPGDVYASTDANYQIGDLFNWGSSSDISITWAFDDLSLSTTDTTLIIKPRIDSVVLSAGGLSFSSSAPNQALFINNAQDNTSITTQGEDWHYDYNSAGFEEFFHAVSIDSIAFDFVRTFKAGCSHDIGVVYYDKFNRSGNVNILGSFYSQPFNHSDREIGSSGVYNNGPTGVKVSFNSDAPDWAERYQLVYAGMNSFTNVFQFTGGGAFYAADSNDRRVYLSLNTIKEYKDRKNAIKDYSFTKGDKLRVISRDTAQGAETVNAQNIEYVFANDGSTIEFNVVGVKTISTASEGMLFFSTPGYSNSAIELIGDFLILEAPAVDASLAVTVGGSETQIKYQGFDWYQISDTDYPNNDTHNQKNYWGHSCLFEILTPRQQTDERVYFEVGRSYLIDDRYKAAVPGSGSSAPFADSDHGIDRTHFFGDLLFSPRSCVTPWRSANVNHYIDGSYNNWNETRIDDWRVETRFMESESISDFKSLNYWDKGRAHVVFENAAEIRRINGITYSDAYAEDVANLSLSSFNPSLANFDSLDGRYGAVEYIGNYNDDLVALQENKLCLIPVNKNIIEYASGSADVAVSTNVLGQRRYSSGDYGSGGNPEAVLIQDNSVYFVDKSRQAVLSLTGGQLVPISEKSMSSFFEDFFATNNDRYVSGYDPRDNTYYITALGGTTPETVGYDAARGVWQSRYSFTPDVYSNQDNMLYSAKYVDAATDLIFHKHDNTTVYNTFYGGTVSPSTVQVVSKLSPSRVKVFNAISYEGDSDKWEMSSGATTNLGQTSGYIHDASGSEAPPFTSGYAEKFQEREGAYYASMPRDLANSSAQYVFLGTVSAQNGVNLTMDPISRLNRLPFRLEQDSEASYGVELAKSSDGITFTALGNYLVDSFDMSSKKIVLTSNPGDLVGQGLYAMVSQDKPMRGNFATITLTNSSTTKHELYCINTHITDSKSHHPLGQ